MKTQRFASLAIFLICLLPVLSQAADKLYYAEQEITDESAETREASIAKALSQVLVRLTGDSQISKRSTVPQLLKNASDYVSQYRYRVDDAGTGAGGDQPQVKRYIMIQFDKNAVNRALATAGIVSWVGRRPEVLTWLAYQQAGTPRLLDGETLPQVTALLLQASANRGLSLQLPLMDLQDQSALSGSDVWKGNETAIRQASQRYGHPVILVARVTGSEGAKWNGSWTMYNRDDIREFSRRGDDLQHAIQRGMDRAADLLAESYAPVVTGAAGALVNVRIMEISSTADYARVMQLMGQQGGVSRVSVKQLQADELLLSVWVAGGVQVLTNSLRMGGELQTVSDMQLNTETREQELLLRLRH